MFIFSYFITTLFIILLSITSYAAAPSSFIYTEEKTDSFQIKISNQGKHLFNILVDKKTEQFAKRIKKNEEYSSNTHELIKVYSTGFYPSFEPNKTTSNKTSIFRTNIMDQANSILDNVLKKNSHINVGILEKTNFDKEKFIRVTQNAINKMYKNINLSVKLTTNKNINNEYSNITLLITHKPNEKLYKPAFFINNSRIPAKPISNIKTSFIEQQHIYKLPIPAGTNKIRVETSSFSGETATDNEIVTNKFKKKPTFHILTIGINDFPDWGDNQQLMNAINDANLVKKTFQNKATKLFNGNININPYNLSIENTTKSNIGNLVKQIRNKVKPNDYFMFYVASHGMIENDKYYFAPSDFSRDDFIKNGIKEDQISDYLINIPTIFRIVILDTCSSGKQVESIKNDINQLPLGRKTGISILTAAKSKQIANDKYKGHGLFTYILTKGLNGSADYNHDSIVDSIEIAQYVKSNVGKISRSETLIPQDSVILPNPRKNHNKRFELTFLDKEKFSGFQPNSFTSRESQLYIDAIKRNDPDMMNGLIRNNARHNYNHAIIFINENKLTIQEIVKQLKTSGSIDISINFEVNSTHLTTSEITKLNLIAQALQTNELIGKRVLLEGHTDSDGTDSENMTLSQKRADAVTKILNERFRVASNRLTSIGFGEIYPIANNDTDDGKRKNRRVSIFML